MNNEKHLRRHKYRGYIIETSYIEYGPIPGWRFYIWNSTFFGLRGTNIVDSGFQFKTELEAAKAAKEKVDGIIEHEKALKEVFCDDYKEPWYFREY